MTICYLGLGSNLGNPQRIIRQAIIQLKKMPKTSVLQVAPLEITDAVGLKAQPRFCNSAIRIKTSLPPHRLLMQCQQMEKRFKRIRKRRWGARTLDIDILLYGNRKENTKELTIPHPRMLERPFVMNALGHFKLHPWGNLTSTYQNQLPFLEI